MVLSGSMIFSNSVKGFFSLVISLCLLFCDLPLAYANLAAPIQPSIVGQTPISLNAGEIVSRIPSEKKNALDLYLIEDAHNLLDAQKSIRSIIKQLKETYPKAMIFVEGTEGPVEWDLFWKFPHQSTKEKVAEYFLQNGRMSGAEVFSAVDTRGEKLFGVETKKAYEENVEAYLNLKKLEEDGLVGLKQFNKAIAKLKGIFYTPQLIAWEKEERILNNNPENFFRYLKFLSTWAKKENVSLEIYPQINALLKISNETSEAFLEEPAMVDQLFIQREALEKTLLTQMDIPRETKLLVQVNHTMKLLTQLFRLELTPQQWQVVEQTNLKKQLDQVIDFFKPFAGKMKMDLGHTEELHTSLVAAHDFYAKAKEREKHISKNLENAVRKANAKTAILISGGFHTESVKQHFAAQKAGLTVIHPKIEDVNNEVPYWEIFQGHKSPLEAWLSEQRDRPYSQNGKANMLAKPTAARDVVFQEVAFALLVASSRPASRAEFSTSPMGQTQLVGDEVRVYRNDGLSYLEVSTQPLPLGLNVSLRPRRDVSPKTLILSEASSLGRSERTRTHIDLSQEIEDEKKGISILEAVVISAPMYLLSFYAFIDPIPDAYWGSWHEFVPYFGSVVGIGTSLVFMGVLIKFRERGERIRNLELKLKNQPKQNPKVIELERKLREQSQSLRRLRKETRWRSEIEEPKQEGGLATEVLLMIGQRITQMTQEIAEHTERLRAGDMEGIIADLDDLSERMRALDNVAKMIESPTSRSMFDVSKIVVAVKQMYLYEAMSRSVQIRTYFNADRQALMVNKGLTIFSLMTLIEQSLYAIPNTGVIKIKVEDQDRTDMAIYVEAIGATKPNIKKLKSVFAKVQTVAQQYGGEAQVIERNGVGLKFKITLPSLNLPSLGGQSVSTAGKEQIRNRPTEELVKQPLEKVLVVEPDLENRARLLSAITTTWGVATGNVTLVNNGAEAVEQLQKDPRVSDVVIINVAADNGSTPKVVGAIQQTRNPPTIFVFSDSAEALSHLSDARAETVVANEGQLVTSLAEAINDTSKFKVPFTSSYSNDDKARRETRAVARAYSLGKTPVEVPQRLQAYFQAAFGPQYVQVLTQIRDTSTAPFAEVFSAEALINGTLPEELVFLFDLLPKLKIYVATRNSHEAFSSELKRFDPEGVLDAYREWGKRSQFIVLDGLSVQEAKTRARDHVGRGLKGEKNTAVFVMGQDEEDVLFLGSEQLKKFSVDSRTHDGKEGLVLGLPTIGLQILQGLINLPEHIQVQTRSGIFRVFGFDIQQLSANLVSEIMALREFAQAA